MAGATSTVRIDVSLLTREAQAQVKLLNDQLNKIGKGMDTKAPDIIEQTGKNLKSTAQSFNNYAKAQETAGLKTSANITRLKGLRTAMDQNATAIKAQESEVKTLTEVYDKNGDALGKEAKQLTEAKNKLAEMKSQQELMGSQVEKLGKQYGNLSPQMAAAIDKQKLFSTKMGDVGNSLDSVGQRMTVGVTTPIVAGLGYATKATMDFDNQIKSMGALLDDGKTSSIQLKSELKQLGDASKGWATQYGVSTSSINNGMSELIKKGYSFKQTMGAMPSILNATKASGEDFNSVMGVSTSTLEQFGLKSNNTSKMLENTKRVTDSLTFVANKTSAGFSDMGYAMEYVGPVAHGLGMSLEQTSAAIGLMSNQGIEGQKAGTALRGALDQLMNPTKQNAQAFKEMGVNIADFKKGSLDLPTIIDKIKNNTKGWTKEQRQAALAQAFGAEAQAGMNILVSQGGDALRDLTKETQNANGYTEKMAKSMNNTSKANVDKLKESLHVLSIDIGANLVPAITPLVKKLTDAVTWFGKLDKGTQGNIIKFGLIAAAIGPGLVAIGKMATGAAALADGWSKAKSAYVKFGDVMRKQPLSQMQENGTPTKGFANQWQAQNKLGKAATVGVGIGVAASAGLDIYGAFKAKNPETKFKKAGQGMGTAIGGGIGFMFGGPAGAALGASIGKVVGGWGGKAAKGFTDGWNKKGRGQGKPPKGFFPKVGYYSRMGIDAVVGFGKGVAKNTKRLGFGGAIAKELGNARKIFMNTPFGSWVGNMVGKFAKAFPNLSKVFSGAFKIVGSIAKTGLNLIGDNMAIWGDLFTGKWDKLGKDISKAWKDLWDGVTGVIKGAWNVISGIAGMIGKAVSGIVGGIKSVGSKIWGKLTGHALGGQISQTHVALVGEEGAEIAYNKKTGKARVLGKDGPEITTVYAGENILTATQTKKALKGKSPNVLNSYAGGTGNPGAIAGSGGSGMNKMGGNSTTKFDVQLSDKDVKKSSKSVQKEIEEMTKKSTKNLKTFADFNKKNWQTFYKDTDKNVTNVKSDGTNNISELSSNIAKIDTETAKTWHTDWVNMSNDYNVQMSKLAGYSRADMNGAITQLNHGISNINGLVAKFGGNTAILPQISTYANGTNGALANDELALVNDGHGPNYRELIQHNDGSFTMMKDRNRLVGLKAGEKVYNGQQTNKLINSGLVVPHALGTVDPDDALLKMVDDKLSHPDVAWKNDYDAQVSTSITPDVARSMAISAKNSIDKQGLPWYAALWEEIADLIGAGSGSRGAFLRYAIENFMGKPYLMGGNGPTYYDCSGMVAAALKHFGVDIGRTTTTMQNTTEKISLDDAKPGDLTIWGHGDGADGHVGIIMNRNGKMFNETPPKAGYGNLHDVSGIPWDGAFRIRQLHDGDNDAKWGVTPRLKALVKSELGSSATQWLGDHFKPSVDGSNNAPGGEIDSKEANSDGGSIDTATLRKAAQIDHVNPSDSFLKMLGRVMMSESGGNAGAENNTDVNAGPNHSVGALQYTAQTWNAFARAGYGNRRSILDNAVAFFNNSDWADSIGYTTYPAWNGMYKWDWKHNGPQGQRRLHADGGWGGTDADIFNEVPGEREVVVNPHRKSAFRWIKEAMAATFKYQPSEAKKAFAPVELPEEMNNLDAGIELPINPVMDTPEAVSGYQVPHEVKRKDTGTESLLSALVQKITNKNQQITVNIDGESIISKNIPLINLLLGDDSVNLDLRGGTR